MSKIFNHKRQKILKKYGIKLLFYLIMFFVLLSFSNTNASDKNSKYVYIKKVLDGDTIVTKHQKQIRYIGIDAPELGQPFSAEAKKYNENLVLHKFVKIEYDKKHQDYLGRDLAYVYVNKIFINKILVNQGLAKVLTVTPDTQYQQAFLNAQKQAQNKKIGLWPIVNKISWLPLPAKIENGAAGQ